MLISSILKNWYLQNKRDLPWRNSSNPYHIWVSEVILQQTRIAQGLPYYERFIDAFPDIAALANAPQEKLLKIWQGLGYYSRARNIQKGARLILDKFNGQLPADYTQLLSINGIGEYTASAIASIAFNLPYAVVDGNVNRVISRVYGVFEPVNQREGKLKVQKLANEILDNNEPGIHNQAIMEFGALLCTPNNPDCSICPLNDLCYAFKHKKIQELPLKVNNTNIQNRYFYYLVIVSDNHIFIRERTGDDIWHGLYEFPLIETTEKLTLEELIDTSEFNSIFMDKPYIILREPDYFIHKLTHRVVDASFIMIQIDMVPDILKRDYTKIKFSEFENYPTSRLIHKYMEKYFVVNKK